MNSVLFLPAEPRFAALRAPRAAFLLALALAAIRIPAAAGDAFDAVQKAVEKTLPGTGESCKVQIEIKTVRQFANQKEPEVKSSAIAGSFWSHKSGGALEFLMRFDTGDYQNMGLLVRPGKDAAAAAVMHVFLPYQGRAIEWTKFANAFVESHFAYEDLLPEKPGLWTYTAAGTDSGCDVIKAEPKGKTSGYSERRLYLSRPDGLIARIQYQKGGRTVKQATFAYESAGGAHRPATIVMTLPESGSSTTWTFTERTMEEVPAAYFDPGNLAEDRTVQSFRKKLGEIRQKIEDVRKEIEALKQEKNKLHPTQATE